MPKDPKIIREGDIVRVINPDFFVRVGYPMSIDTAKQEICENFNDDIDKLVNKIFILSNIEDAFGMKAKAKVVSALAYEWIKFRRFGGNERSIYTQRIEDKAGIECFVYKVRYVKTGLYNPPRYGYDTWSGENDYEPGYLSDEKTHKILDIGFQEEIEASNVEKIESGKEQVLKVRKL